MKYLVASIYYDFAHYEDANELYMKYLEKHPQHEFAATAVKHMVGYYKAQDPGDLEDLIEDLLEIPGLAKNKAVQPLLKKPK